MLLLQYPQWRIVAYSSQVGAGRKMTPTRAGIASDSYVVPKYYNLILGTDCVRD